MIRKTLTKNQAGKKNNFQWRGGEVSRIEGFSDAVFAFAITLLVVSLEVPKTFSELTHAMLGFFPFAACFAFIVYIWYQHYIYFRRYGLDDVYVIILNALLLFVILFYIYPLKFLFSYLSDIFFNINNGESRFAISGSQAPYLMIIYSSGYFAIFFVFMLLQMYALKKKDVLQLNAAEEWSSRTYLHSYVIHMLVSLLSILLAAFGGSSFVSIAGWIYILVGPLHAVNGILMSKRLNRIPSEAV